VIALRSEMVFFFDKMSDSSILIYKYLQSIESKLESLSQGVAYLNCDMQESGIMPIDVSGTNDR